MELTDVAPIDVWKKLEDDLYSRSGLNIAVFDMEGTRITGSQNWVNRLCPEVKAHPKGQTFICSLSHQTIVNQTVKLKKPVIDECDAGLVKMVVPILVDNKVIGVVGGCGLLPPDGEVDTFLIQKTIGGKESRLIDLAADVQTVSSEKLNEITDYIEKQIEKNKLYGSTGLPN